MNPHRSRFLLHFVLPAAAAITLFVAALVGVFIPTVERAVIERKREMIRELANVACSTLDRYAREAQAGRLSLLEAQQQAIQELRQIRYGPQGKDYYWIIDLTPRMVMHPYLPELEGQDLKALMDSRGRHLFLEQVDRTAEAGSAYLEYIWQWKDDPGRRAPKLSFVRRFHPWGWIVGTGLYLEDVHQEMAQLKHKLLGLSLAITVAVAGILAWIGLHAGRSEQLRLLAEHNLRQSEARHRTLVQASSEGLLLLQEGRPPIVNGHLMALLGLSEPIPAGTLLATILGAQAQLPGGTPLLQALLEAPGALELRLGRRDGSTLEAQVRATRERFGPEEGIVVTVKDLSARPSEALAAEAWGQELAERFEWGVFRATWGRHWRLLAASGTARGLLLEPGQALADVDLLARLRDRADAADLLAQLEAGGAVRERRVAVDGARGLFTGSLSLARVRSADGSEELLGILLDASARSTEEGHQARVLEDLQLGQHATYRDLAELVQAAPVLGPATPARTVAERLAYAPGGAVLVASTTGAPCGILTHRDLCDRVLAQGLGPDTPLQEFMTAPLVRISRRALVLEALLALETQGCSHLAVTDERGEVLGVLPGASLLMATPQAGSRLLEAIRQARAPEALAGIMARVPAMVRSLHATGVHGAPLTRFLTVLMDAVCQKALAWAEADLGPPPAPFAWVALGSHGRAELGLVSDQDHALILADGAPLEAFLERGRHLAGTLAAAGWKRCPGGVMAGEPAWTAEVTAWKRKFSGWIHAGEPKDLLEVHIGFDLRFLAGAPSLAQEVGAHVRQAVAQHPPFLPLLALAAQQTKPVLTKLGGIHTEPDERVDLKNALGRLVNAVRIYALRAGVAEVATLDRLAALRRLDAGMEADHGNIVAAFGWLTALRLQAQLDNGTNLLDLRRLPEPDRAALKKALGQVDHLNARLATDFLGRG